VRLRAVRESADQEMHARLNVQTAGWKQNQRGEAP